MTIRLLAVADLHQRPAHYHRLAALVQKHQPQIIAFVGDFLNSDGNNGRNGLLTEAECAECVAHLPAERTIFVRGNHEERNWAHFMDGWPKSKPLECLYGNALVHGPLVIVGFPCPMGEEATWAFTMPRSGTAVDIEARTAGREPLGVQVDTWLRPLVKKFGPAARTLWLMHMPPMGLPIADRRSFNLLFIDAVENYKPLLTISGHDHHTPHLNGTWHARFDGTTCINAGQDPDQTCFTVTDLTFSSSTPSLPKHIQVRAYPWNQNLAISPA